MTLTISRRSLLGATAALPALAIPSAATSAEHPLVAQMRASREKANARFWELHAQFVALEAEWEACDDDDESSDTRLRGLVREKFEDVMLQPVSCAQAVLTKLKMTDFNPANMTLPYPAETADRMIEWDLERCAQERVFGV